MTEPMTDQKTTAVEFKSPGADAWRPISALGNNNDAEKNAAKINKDELKDTLRASLQMQHLVVLAGSGCSRSAGGPSMLDLWNAAVGEEPTKAAREVAGKVHYELADKNIEAFLSKTESFLDVNEDKSVAAFLNASKKTILEQCSGFADRDSLNAHKTFLHRLSRRRVRDQRLKIFTTNYDVCFEEAAGCQGGVVLDGFSFTAERYYDPRYFSYDIVRRPRSGDDLGNYLEGVFHLYKLHGSVNWAQARGGTIIQKARPEPEEACLIYPARGKYQQSFTQPYLESMAQYLAAVREPNTCVLVVGFGFNDDHLAEPLLAAATSNPHLRLIIVDRDPRAKTTRRSGYWAEFADLGAQGEDVWFIAADFRSFAKTIPDLKSHTPGDTLTRAIQGVAGER